MRSAYAKAVLLQGDNIFEILLHGIMVFTTEQINFQEHDAKESFTDFTTRFVSDPTILVISVKLS